MIIKEGGKIEKRPPLPPFQPFRYWSAKLLDDDSRALLRDYREALIEEEAERRLVMRCTEEPGLQELRQHPIVKALEKAKALDRLPQRTAATIFADMILHTRRSDGTASRAPWSLPSRLHFQNILLKGDPGGLAAATSSLPGPTVKTVKDRWSKLSVSYKIGGKPGDTSYDQRMDEIRKLLLKTLPGFLRPEQQGDTQPFRVPFSLGADDTAVEKRVAVQWCSETNSYKVWGLQGGPYFIEPKPGGDEDVIRELLKLLNSRNLITSLRLYVLTARSISRPRPKIVVYAELHSNELTSQHSGKVGDMLVQSLQQRGIDVDTEAGDVDQRFRKLVKAAMHSAKPRRDTLRLKHPLMRFFGMPMKHGKHRGMTIDPLHGAVRVKRQMIRTSRPMFLGRFMIRRNFIRDLGVEPYVNRLLNCLRARDLMYKHKSYYPALWRLAGLNRQTGHPLPPETNFLSILQEDALKSKEVAFAQELWYLTCLHNLMSMVSNRDLTPQEYIYKAARVLAAMVAMRMLAEIEPGREFVKHTLTLETYTDVVLIAVAAILSVVRCRECGYEGTVAYDCTAGATIWVEHVFGLARAVRGRAGMIVAWEVENFLSRHAALQELMAVVGDDVMPTSGKQDEGNSGVDNQASSTIEGMDEASEQAKAEMGPWSKLPPDEEIVRIMYAAWEDEVKLVKWAYKAHSMEMPEQFDMVALAKFDILGGTPCTDAACQIEHVGESNRNILTKILKEELRQQEEQAQQQSKEEKRKQKSEIPSDDKQEEEEEEDDESGDDNDPTLGAGEDVEGQEEEESALQDMWEDPRGAILMDQVGEEVLDLPEADRLNRINRATVEQESRETAGATLVNALLQEPEAPRGSGAKFSGGVPSIHRPQLSTLQAISSCINSHVQRRARDCITKFFEPITNVDGGIASVADTLRFLGIGSILSPSDESSPTRPADEGSRDIHIGSMVAVVNPNVEARFSYGRVIRILVPERASSKKAPQADAQNLTEDAARSTTRLVVGELVSLEG